VVSVRAAFVLGAFAPARISLIVALSLKTLESAMARFLGIEMLMCFFHIILKHAWKEDLKMVLGCVFLIYVNARWGCISG
jgi:hypothetical protein